MFPIRARKLTRFLAAAVVLVPACSAVTAKAQTPAARTERSTDVGFGYVAQRSLRAASSQNFWMGGGSVELGSSLWHGIGPTVNVTGSHTGSIGSSGVPLSLLTVTAGPRIRLRDGRVSPYGEALFGIATGFSSVFPNPGGATPTAASFALLAGGGVDVHLHKGLFVRAVEASYVYTQLPNGTDNTQNILHLGAGLGWRFSGKKR